VEGFVDGIALNLRSLEQRDVESVLAIQSTCPEIAQWSMWDYSRVARGEMSGWVAEDGDEVAGFLVARRIVSDIEILNFAVHPESRRNGTGSLLLQGALDWARSLQSEKALLEVRASNIAAMKFYERFGFQVNGRRPRYYTAPIEDALLLTASLTSRRKPAISESV
jgi:[ribosomal protein S18]-alanine N-acetyltransferase